ncbi:hypothetical protein THAOC_05979, partial [Thalassiosira oceanica]
TLSFKSAAAQAKVFATEEDASWQPRQTPEEEVDSATSDEMPFVFKAPTTSLGTRPSSVTPSHARNIALCREVTELLVDLGWPARSRGRASKESDQCDLRAATCVSSPLRAPVSCLQSSRMAVEPPLSWARDTDDDADAVLHMATLDITSGHHGHAGS